MGHSDSFESAKSSSYKGSNHKAFNNIAILHSVSQTEKMDPVSKEEIQLLDELRAQIKDLGLSEEELEYKNLVRFIRARNGDVNAAEQMIRNNVEWRTVEDVKSLLNDYEFPKSWNEDFGYDLVGFDRNRCPIILAPFGKWDIQKEMALGNKEEFVRYVFHHMEKLWTMLKRMSKKEDHMKQIVGIVDLEGLSFRQVTSLDVVEAAVRCLKTFEANYPESVKAAVVVNAPWAFQLIWKIVSPFLSERTHAKLQFVGSDREKWKEAISKLAEPDQFPEYYGGEPNDRAKKYFLFRDGRFRCSQNENQNEEEEDGFVVEKNSNAIIEL